MDLQTSNADLYEDFRTGLVFGDYQILRRIGSGAMADVYLAHQQSLDREIAIKILKDELSGDETGVRRFVQEAQAAARLEHPNIVHIYEVGSFVLQQTRLATGGFFKYFNSRFLLKRRTKNPVHYIAQEYVPGMNLQQYIRLRGHLSIRQTLAVMIRVCSALERAGHLGIVHRDIKPENILLSGQGVVKITDFGLAYLETMHAERSLSLTQIGLTLGTPLYMSPEQAEGRTLDFRSDIYSFGITAFQMLTGQPPFIAETPLAVILQHMNRPVPDLREIRPEISENFAAILTKMMAKKPDDRFASFDDLTAILKKEQKNVLLLANRSKGETDPPDWELEEFFSDSDEHEVFNASLRRTELSMTLQTSLFRLKALKEKERRTFHFSKKSQIFFPLLLVIFFLLGFGWTLYRTVSDPPFKKLEMTPAVARLDTVEEQWVLASQLGTVDAWKSVIQFFPEKEYWKRKAQQQLALVYMKESNSREAREIFVYFVEMTPPDKKYENFGLAGVAWCMAFDGKVNDAVRTLSNLRSEQIGSFDRLTEDVISKAQEMIRK